MLRLVGARLTLASVFGLGTLILLSDPGKFDLRTGQPTLMIVIALLLALRAVPRAGRRRHRRRRAQPAGVVPVGVLGVVVVWSKPTFAIPLVVLLIALGRTRLAIAGTALAAAISALMLPLLVDAAGGFGNLVDSWQDSARITSQSPQSRLGSGLRIDAATRSCGSRTCTRRRVWRPSAGSRCSLAGAWLLSGSTGTTPAGDREELAITLACLLILMSMYHVPYDYLLLVDRSRVAVPARRPIRSPGRAGSGPRSSLMLLVPLVDPLGWSPVNAVLGKSGFQWMFGTDHDVDLRADGARALRMDRLRQLRGATDVPVAPVPASTPVHHPPNRRAASPPGQRRGPFGQARWAVSLKPRSAGDRSGAPIRVIDATSRCMRQASSGSASIAQIAAALIGDTWLTATTGGPSIELPHSDATRSPTATRLSPPGGANDGVRPPPREVLGRELGERSLVPLAVVHLHQPRLHLDRRRRARPRSRPPSHAPAAAGC